MAANQISITLSEAEMLVLFDWLARSSEAGSPIVELHDAERRVLWDLEAVLETRLPAPFSDQYGSLLDSARAEVLGQPDQE